MAAGHRTGKWAVKNDLTQDLDRVIHEKGRMGIMAVLAASPEMSFTDMRSTLGMTDGNLTTHLRTLQDAGYVILEKTQHPQRRPVTLCRLTPAGRVAFAGYVEALERFVAAARHGTV
jgi:DNA-binding MarR family transcriptional regulator